MVSLWWTQQSRPRQRQQPLWIRETWERTIAEDLGLPAPAAPDYHELMCMLPHALSTPALARLIHRDYKKRRGQND